MSARRQIQSYRRQQLMAGGDGSSFSPTQLSGLVVWARADRGVTLGATPLATGTTPPVLTLSGNLAQSLGFKFICSTGGTLTNWKYDWSIDNGATWVATGVTSAAGPVALGSTGVSLAIAAGTANVDNVWEGTVATAADQSGNGNDFTQSTAARQPLLSVAGFGGLPAFDWRTGSAQRKLVTPAVSLATYTFASALRCDSGGVYWTVHNNDVGADGAYVYAETGDSFDHHRGSVASSYNVSTHWLDDGVRRSVSVNYGGTHATHFSWRNGVADTLVSSVGNEPGSGALSGIVYLGNSGGGSSSFRGLIAEHLVFNRALGVGELALLHKYLKSEWTL